MVVNWWQSQDVWLCIVHIVLGYLQQLTYLRLIFQTLLYKL
jgi:hypothetical protein